MKNKIYLLGGGNQNEFTELDRKLAKSSKTKKIFVMNLTTDDKQKIENKKLELLNHFKKVGYKEVKFASDSANILDELKNSEVLFISGGDTEVLLRNIEERNLTSLIKSFKGIIEGNSAGAYICCKGYVKIKDNEVKIIPTLGLVDFYCKAHYSNKFNSALLKLSEHKKIYGISEDSMIVCENDKLDFVGNVYLFSNKKIEKVS